MTRMDKLIALLEKLLAAILGRSDSYIQRLLATMEEIAKTDQLILAELRELNKSERVESSQWMWSNEVMQYLGISDSTLYRARIDGLIHARLVGRRYKYWREDVEKCRNRYLK